MGVGDVAYDPDESIRARAPQRTARKKYRSHESYLKDLQGAKAVKPRITVDELDVLMLRNVPSDDYSEASLGVRQRPRNSAASRCGTE